MRFEWHVYHESRNRWLLLTGGLLAAGLWVATMVYLRSTSEITPLHYTIYFGIDLSGPPNRFLLLPMFGGLSWLTHGTIATLNQDSVWTKTWLLLNILIELLLAAAITALIYFLRTTT